MVVRERRRLVGSASADLRRTLTERFLARNLASAPGPILEVGPGPGRFTTVLGRLGRPLVLLDLAVPMLRAARRATARGLGRRTARPAFVQAAAEALPFPARTFGAVVLVGLFGFFAGDGPAALTEAARVLRPGGRLVVETQSRTQSIGSILPGAPETARTIYRRPREYHLARILARGDQPLDPAHYANWEYRYWRAPELEGAVRAAGFDPVDRMSVGPGVGLHGSLAAALRRDRVAWPHVVATEEVLGRWPENWGAGAAFLLAARRRPTGRPNGAPARGRRGRGRRA